MIVQVFDHIYDEIPSLDEVNMSRILPLDFPSGEVLEGASMRMSALATMYRQSDYPKEHMYYIGNKPGPANNEECEQVLDMIYK